MVRLFLACPLPEAMIDRLADAMSGGPPGLRWVDEDNLHCTLRFIGEVDGAAFDAIGERVAGTAVAAPEAAIDGVGVFDHGRHGALWARLSPKRPLKDLHDKFDRVLVALGLPSERRAYLPHVTLARWSGGALDTRGWAARHAGLSSAAMRLGQPTLFESRLGRHGPTYFSVIEAPHRT